MSNDSAPLDMGGDRPSPARMYDYFLGGSHNFEADRVAAEQVIAAYPEVRQGAQANRAFLRRAVRFLSEQGIDQFLDIGAGIPTVGNTHEVAQGINPEARVVYVDVDPVAVRHSEAILKDIPNAAVIQADVREPEAILNQQDVRRLVDMDRPVGLLLLALLHFITDDEEVLRIVCTFRDALAPGSYIAISHGTFEGAPEGVVERAAKLYSRSTAGLSFRSHAQLSRLFEGLDLVDPGIVHLPLWRPEAETDVFLEAPARSVGFVGVGRKGVDGA